VGNWWVKTEGGEILGCLWKGAAAMERSQGESESAEVRELRRRRRELIHAQVDQMLDAMEQRPDDQVFGSGEFFLRDRGAELLRNVLQGELDARKKRRM
jgi:hypothetical protein